MIKDWITRNLQEQNSIQFYYYEHENLDCTVMSYLTPTLEPQHEADI